MFLNVASLVPLPVQQGIPRRRDSSARPSKSLSAGLLSRDATFQAQTADLVLVIAWSQLELSYRSDEYIKQLFKNRAVLRGITDPSSDGLPAALV